jgi:hypothetical protein
MVDVVDIAEESKEYGDERVVFWVAEVNGVDLPVKGRLLCHSESCDEIHEMVMALPKLL